MTRNNYHVCSCGTTWVCDGTEQTCDRIAKGGFKKQCWCIECFLKIKNYDIQAMLRFRDNLTNHSSVDDLLVCYPNLKEHLKKT